LGRDAIVSAAIAVFASRAHGEFGPPSESDAATSPTISYMNCVLANVFDETTEPAKTSCESWWS